MSDTLRCSHGYLLGQCTVCAAMPDVRYWRKRAIAAKQERGRLISAIRDEARFLSEIQDREHYKSTIRALHNIADGGSPQPICHCGEYVDDHGPAHNHAPVEMVNSSGKTEVEAALADRDQQIVRPK